MRKELMLMGEVDNNATTGELPLIGGNGENGLRRKKLPFIGEIKREEHETVYLSSRIREDGKPFGILEKTDKFRVSLEKFRRLSKMSLGFFASSAGLGHKTPLLAVAHAFDRDSLRAYTSVISDDVHASGSSGWQEKIMKKVSEDKRAQQKWERVQLFFIMSDTSLVEKDARQVLENSPQRDVLFFFAHPDSLIAFSTMKKDLEKEYGKKVTTALLMTDHFQKYDQHTWARLEADMILAPDARSAELTEKRIKERAEEFFGAEKDKYRLPVVLNIHGFPVELGLKEKLSKDEFNEKKNRLSSDLNKSPRILIPLGGALPQRDLIAGISANLIKKEGYDISERVTVLHKKEGQEYETFVFAMKRNGTKVVSCETTDEAIDETHKYLAGMNGNFDILLTKPSEKVNVAQFAPDKAGGLIMAFLPPVGSQEEENLRFLRSYEGGHILLSELQEKRLYEFLHRIDEAGVFTLSQEGRLREWQSKAKNLRGVTLPEDPKEAAFILYACKKYGIFEAMTEFRPKADANVDMSEDGAILTLEALEDGLKQIEESGNRGKPTFIHEMPRVKNPENLSQIDHLRILLGVSPEDKLYKFFTLENIQILAKYLGQMSILGLEEKLARARARRLLKE